MPYIKKLDRKKFEPSTKTLNKHISTCGELNYVMTKLCHQYIQKKGLCYANINEVIGAVECMKMELYRMIAAPYEEEKIDKNGMVTGLDEDLNEDRKFDEKIFEDIKQDFMMKSDKIF
jgi:hypothetical protein